MNEDIFLLSLVSPQFNAIIAVYWQHFLKFLIGLCPCTVEILGSEMVSQ